MVSDHVSVRQKLLVVRPTMGQGGADRVTLTLLQRLDRSAFDISLALSWPEGEFLADVPADVRVHCLNRRLRSAWWPLAQLVRREKPDIVFSTCSGANAIVVIARWLSRRRFRVVLSERAMLLRDSKRLKRRLGVCLKRWLYPRAECVTAVSEGVKEDLVRRLSLAPARITVVYNPIVTEELEAGMTEEVDHPWFHHGTPVMLGVGRLIPEKDFATLIEAFARVRAAWDARLMILGDGELRSRLTERIRALGLQDDISLPGFDKNPFKYMARATVFVLSSRQEGLPGVLIQAMACGAAVVSTDCPSGPSEIITHSVDGWLVPVGDIDALAERLRFYMDQPAARERMAAHARMTAQRYRADTILPSYTNALLGYPRERTGSGDASVLHRPASSRMRVGVDRSL